MRINEDRSPIQDMAQGRGVSSRKDAAGGAELFGRVLQEEQGRADSKATLNRLLQQITEQGELIARRRDVGDIRRYRELVSNFLEEATRSAWSADKEGSLDARGRYKEYSTVKRVNEEVENLAAQALADQRDNLKILEQLGTIRGLLVDLLV